MNLISDLLLGLVSYLLISIWDNFNLRFNIRQVGLAFIKCVTGTSCTLLCISVVMWTREAMCTVEFDCKSLVVFAEFSCRSKQLLRTVKYQLWGISVYLLYICFLLLSKRNISCWIRRHLDSLFILTDSCLQSSCHSSLHPFPHLLSNTFERLGTAAEMTFKQDSASSDCHVASNPTQNGNSISGLTGLCNFHKTLL